METSMKNMMYSLLVSAFVAAPATLGAADLRSPALAKQLVTLMTERGLETVAAGDPDSPDRFVAAMAFPGVQLLVVAARYPAPAVVQGQLAAKQFADVYAELQAAPIKESKLLDGDWKKARLSKTAYDEKVSTADRQYSRLLEILIAGLKSS
jgi:hypothetical protein